VRCVGSASDEVLRAEGATECNQISAISLLYFTRLRNFTSIKFILPSPQTAQNKQKNYVLACRLRIFHPQRFFVAQCVQVIDNLNRALFCNDKRFISIQSCVLKTS
jgi:hypothetical protein